MHHKHINLRHDHISDFLKGEIKKVHRKFELVGKYGISDMR